MNEQLRPIGTMEEHGERFTVFATLFSHVGEFWAFDPTAVGCWCRLTTDSPWTDATWIAADAVL